MTEEKRYWVCHVRGGDFQILRKLGFETLYPVFDDYVFLEVSKENNKIMRRKGELGIYFVSAKNKLITISQVELDRMKESTVTKFKVGSEITVVEGPGSNLDGKVLELGDGKIRCELKGYNRTYDIWVDKLGIVLKGDEYNTVKLEEDELE